jgi:hypothetical protein
MKYHFSLVLNKYVIAEYVRILARFYKSAVFRTLQL